MRRRPARWRRHSSAGGRRLSLTPAGTAAAVAARRRGRPRSAGPPARPERPARPESQGIGPVRKRREDARSGDPDRAEPPGRAKMPARTWPGPLAPAGADRGPPRSGLPSPALRKATRFCFREHLPHPIGICPERPPFARGSRKPLQDSLRASSPLAGPAVGTRSSSCVRSRDARVAPLRAMATAARDGLDIFSALAMDRL